MELFRGQRPLTGMWDRADADEALWAAVPELRAPAEQSLSVRLDMMGR